MNDDLLVETLRALVAAPSISSRNRELDQSPDRVVAAWAEQLERIGGQTEIHDNGLRPGKPIVTAKVGESAEIGAILAGHIDTVPAVVDEWGGDPWTLREKDGRWIGLGTTDMKGFFAASLSALDSLRGRLQRSVLLVATTDEESGMEGMRHLAAAGRLPVAPTIVGEPTSGKIAAGSKGIYMLRLHISGVDGHASRPPDTGRTIDAVRLLLDRLAALECRLEGDAKLRDPRYSPACPTLNVGRLDVGDVANRLAAQGNVDIEFRLLPGMSSADCNGWLNAAVKEIADQTQTAIDFEGLHELPAFSNEAMADAVRMPYACEAGFFPDARQVVIWGPGDLSEAHTSDESVDIAGLLQYRGDLTQWLSERCLR